ncbi:hypothetical protein BJX61DRAFT_85669 [Aspergillus egyptiacus]|nr:hypothetical protein BJX61DRAFT_85669 [Aspergillus egyptiacus]
MSFELSPCPSDDELALSPKGKEVPRPKAMNKHHQNPTYVPQSRDDELDSQEARGKLLMPAPQKRKFEGERNEEVSVLGESDLHLQKKPRSFASDASSCCSIAPDAADQPVLEIGLLVTPELQQDSQSPSSDVGSIYDGVNSTVPAVHKGRKRSTIFDDKSYVEESDDENKELENSYSIPENEKATMVFDFDRERARRLEGASNIPEDTYTAKERELFIQLAMRGFEPLAPKFWQFDFPTLPDSLFPESGNEEADLIIKISRSTPFHAIKSLANLFSLSGRVRDCSIVGRRPEHCIKRTIKRYIRWALFDASLELSRGSLPVHVIHAQKQHETILDALECVNRRLKRLAVRHQRALAEVSDSNFSKDAPISDGPLVDPPLLIGFVICGPVVALMTFDLALWAGKGDESDGKFMTQFDLSERGQDVWNSLSITIVAMYIRNTMVRLSKEGYGGYVKSSRTASIKEDL